MSPPCKNVIPAQAGIQSGRGGAWGGLSRTPLPRVQSGAGGITPQPPLSGGLYPRIHGAREEELPEDMAIPSQKS